MKDELQSVKDDLQSVKDELQSVKDELQILKERVQKLEIRMTSLEVTLENVTNKNIILVAEGHLDLSRKLDEALRVENEKEIIAIRVNILENELKKMKEQLKVTA